MCFLLDFRKYLFLAQSDQVYLFLAAALNTTPTPSMVTLDSIKDGTSLAHSRAPGSQKRWKSPGNNS